MSADYDLVIIGVGAAGLTGGPFAVRLGARTALVERDRIGGDCTWTGCVPSKTLVKAARLAQQMRTAANYGLPSHEPPVDFGTVMQHVKRVIDVIYQPTAPESLRGKGMDVLLGEPRFRDAHHITVDGQNVTASKTNYMHRGPPVRSCNTGFGRCGLSNLPGYLGSGSASPAYDRGGRRSYRLRAGPGLSSPRRGHHTP